MAVAPPLFVLLSHPPPILSLPASVPAAPRAGEISSGSGPRFWNRGRGWGRHQTAFIPCPGGVTSPQLQARTLGVRARAPFVPPLMEGPWAPSDKCAHSRPPPPAPRRPAAPRDSVVLPRKVASLRNLCSSFCGTHGPAPPRAAPRPAWPPGGAEAPSRFPALSPAPPPADLAPRASPPAPGAGPGKSQARHRGKR